MTSDDPILEEDAELLLYLADELEPSRRTALEQRLATSAELRRKLDGVREFDGRLAASAAVAAPSALVADRALKSTLRAVRERSLRRGFLDYSARRSRRRPPAYAVAAGVAILCTLGFIAWLYTTPPVTVAPVVSDARPGFGTFGGQGPLPTAAFSPIGVEAYADTSRDIDLEIDALSLLADFEEDPESN